MPSRTKTLVGLEIEPHGLTAAHVSLDADGLVVRRAVHAPLEPGVVRDGEVVDAEALTEAIRGLWKDARGLGRRVRVGIANQKIVVRVIDLPVLPDPKELAAAVQFRAGEEIPMPLEGAVLDFRPLDVIEGDGGPRQRVLLVAARRDMVERVLGAVRDAGLRCEGIDLAAFALVRALHPPGDTDRLLYLAIGGQTNLAVADGTTCLFTRATGGGVDALATELAERRGITLEAARAVLLQTPVPLHAGADGAPPAPANGPRWGDVPDPAAAVRAAAPEPEPEPEVAPLRWTVEPGAPPSDAGSSAEPAPLRWGEVPDPAAPSLPPAIEAPTEPLVPPPPLAEPAPAAPERPDPVDAVAAEAREVLLEGVRRIAADVRTSLDFHAAQGDHARVARVLLTGPATEVPGFAEALGAQLKLDVLPCTVRGATGDVPHPSVAAGLAIEEVPA